MVKPARHKAAVPELSISIPQGTTSKHTNHPAENATKKDAGRRSDTEASAHNEPYPKQVTFLDDEDSMSDQSSICQSPSWENYGQRKKEKKLEAERRKKEKEQAAKELKEARKRAAARLSKPPPTTTSDPDPRNLLMTADHSLSDTSLVTRRILQSTQSLHRFVLSPRAASTDSVPRVASVRPPMPSPRAIPDSKDDSSTQDLHPTTLTDNDNRPVRPTFRMPPRREPRHHSTPPSGRTQSTESPRDSADPKSSQVSQATTSSADSISTSGYVSHQRAQAKQRAIASLVDEHVVAKATQYYPPSRSSTGPVSQGRRSSITLEAKSVALKLVNLTTPLAVRAAADAANYTKFKAIPYSPSSGVGRSVSAVSTPASPSGTDSPRHNTSTEQPPPLQDSANSSVTQTTGSMSKPQNKKSRILVDVAKAALSLSKGPSNKSPDESKASTPLPPTPPARSQMRPSPAAEAEAAEPPCRAGEATRCAASVSHDRPQSCVQCTPDIQQDPTSAPAENTKRETLAPQREPQASEGSSSSSGYDDGSPVPSRTSTPDTSRPQSIKDAPLTSKTHDVPKADERQVDEKTLLRTPDVGEACSPQEDDARAHERTVTREDEQWSRTALPLDIEADAESFVTSVSTQEKLTEKEMRSSPRLSNAQPTRLMPSLPKPDPSNPDPALDATATTQRAGKQKRRLPSTPLTVIPPPADPGHGDEQDMEDGMSVQTGQGIAAHSGEQSKTGIVDTSVATMAQAGVQGQIGFSPERPITNFSRKPTRPASQPVNILGGVEKDGVKNAPGNTRRERISRPASTSSSALLGGTSPHLPEMGFTIRNKGGDSSSETSGTEPGPSSKSSANTLHPATSKASRPPRSSSLSAPPRPPTPSARASGGMPVSILKRPKTPTQDMPPSPPSPQVLSALPKHIQGQAGRPTVPNSETRTGPIAKILVECCNCKFYHDMPSKLYECIAKPDAVVEDKVLGISGAITTMVKCPWCGHNMSRTCCAGYAAMVYLKERLH
jgi:hypothetical protein